jgi:hypothetical protein
MLGYSHSHLIGTGDIGSVGCAVMKEKYNNH